MTAAPKWNPSWKLPCEECIASRTRQNLREAEVAWEETSRRTRRSRRGMGPSAFVETTEITSGRAISQQGLAATCKDCSLRVNRGDQRDLVRRMSQYERRRLGNAGRSGARRRYTWGNTLCVQRCSRYMADTLYPVRTQSRHPIRVSMRGYNRCKQGCMQASA